MNESIVPSHENGETLAEQLLAQVVTQVVTQVAEPTPIAGAVFTGDSSCIGRYTRTELAAMQGKRGRKPPEFYRLFPKPEAGEMDGLSQSKPSKRARTVSRRALPPAARISSAVIGEHTIDELLELVGAPGKKPVAYDILHQAAQVFADRGALDLPPATVDPLAHQVATAPVKIRELISELIRLGKR